MFEYHNMICVGTPGDSHYQYHIPVSSCWPPGCILFLMCKKIQILQQHGQIYMYSISFHCIGVLAIVSGYVLYSRFNKTSLITTSFENYHLGRIA